MYLGLNEIVSFLLIAIYYISGSEINIFVIVLLWIHLIKGIISYIIDIVLWEDYLNISSIIDIAAGLMVFFRDFSWANEAMHVLMILLFIKTIYEWLSPADKIFGED